MYIANKIDKKQFDFSAYISISKRIERTTRDSTLTMTFNPSKRQALGRSFVARDSVAATQSTFFGTKAPSEVTQLALSLPNTDQATFIKLLKFVLEYIKGTEVITNFIDKDIYQLIHAI